MGAKNVIVCCDGTGQSYVGPTSNALQIYELALKDPGTQVACYDPGVGTLPAGARSLGGRWLRRGAELWLGWGAIENVTELYRYLMQHHEQDDKIFLFGFSRGAFTVRALAAMIHVCGLLRRDDEHLLPYAAGLFQTSERRIAAARKSKGNGPRVKSEPGADHAKCDCEAALFKERLSKPCTIEFLGLWDTVKAYGWFWPQSFPALRHNPSVRRVRHAVALNERRSSFQLTGWGDSGPDVREVWFRGDHSDVGGGHACRSALSDATLGWILGEAVKAGLEIDPCQGSTVDTLVERGRLASSCEPNDLRHRWYRLAEIAPRFELNNKTYPPRRLFRCWPTGTRCPDNHLDAGKLRRHESVTHEQAARFSLKFAEQPEEPTLPAVFPGHDPRPAGTLTD